MNSRDDGKEDGAGLNTDALTLSRGAGGRVAVMEAATALPPPAGEAANRSTASSTAKASR